MPAGSVAVKERHQPMVLVDTAGLSEEEWLAYRRKGIGGSDVAALLGISPWRTARDLFYDKLNIAVVEDHEDNWVALEMGHLLEPLVAKIFQHRTGYKVYQIKKMFQHPKYPWMLADVDYFVELPDGTTAILEIKTTNYNAKDNWWLDGEETIPAYYESQGRHYMAVMDVDRCFFCCLYGNNEQESIIRDMQRDLAYEDEMIFLEQNFWENHVLTRTPPPYTEDGDLVIESVRRYTGPADKEAPAVSLDLPLTAKLMRFLQLQEQKKGAEAGKKEIEEDMKRLKAAIIAKMGKSCKAICQQDGVNYTVTYNPIRTPGIDKDRLSFKAQYLRGLCELAHIEDCIELWQHLAENKTCLTEYLGLTREEHETFLRQGRDALGILLEPQRRKQRFVLYQLELDEQKAIPFAFKELAALQKAGYEQPPAAMYRMVGAGEIYCPVEQSDAEILKRLFADCREGLPEDCHGRPMALSDVVELDHSPRRVYYYVNGEHEFPQVKFSPMLAKKDIKEGT